MKLLVSAGPTREYIDDVRFITNASSGMMGYELARIALTRGHQVTLVTGPTSLGPPAVEVVEVVSAEDMHKAILERFEDSEAVVMTAAVADYTPARRIKGKLKKTGEEFVLRLLPTPDILSELARMKGSKILVGFALEAEELVPNAQRKMQEKNLDIIVANPISAIGSPSTTAHILLRDGREISVHDQPKTLVASTLLELIEELYSAQRT